MILDHLVQFLKEPDIALYAERTRSWARVANQLPIDPVKILEFLNGKELPGKGQLSMKLFDQKDGQPSAYVTFLPPIIHIDEEVLHFAKIGDPHSRFIVAHEIGHAILHDQHAQAFSGKEKDFTAFSFQERSAEWQANIFASYLLAPDNLSITCLDADELSLRANIEKSRAEAILNSLNRRKLWKPPIYLGDTCTACFNFSMVQSGKDIFCKKCGMKSSTI